MADTALVIVEGRITDVEKRTGTNDRGPWSMETIHILVANRGMVEVSMPRNLGIIGGEIPAVDSHVSWLVRLSAGRFGLSGSIVGLSPRAANRADSRVSGENSPAQTYDLSDDSGLPLHQGDEEGDAPGTGLDFGSLLRQEHADA